ncbi:MAG: RNA 2',3'-cyclic phosphodiesterase, partial [Sandaracinaceae bacterium]|nr:RNA 2',3'-cyclic phosphodiesterase [Sandaracinaceae bacterium]
VGKARWVGTDELHLTLRFIGNADERTATRLVELAALRSWSAPSIALRGVGVFGPLERARVLWVGVAPDPALLALAADLEAIAREAGLAPEARPFAPHLTLARLKAPRAAALQTYLRKHEALEIAPFRATELVLFESRQGPSGVTYHPFHTFALA